MTDKTSENAALTGTATSPISVALTEEATSPISVALGSEQAAQPIPAQDISANPTTALTGPYPELVRFDGVTKIFGHGEKKKIALQDINFVVHDIPRVGELIAIVGASGCGKSTLLRIIAGLKPHFPPTKGEVKINGKQIDGPSVERGLIDQHYSLLPNLTVLENVAFGLMLKGVKKKERLALAKDWVKKVKLDGAESKYPFELSGGMKQRVSIAATLILKPRILLMDEPFGALDPKTRFAMQELLVQLWEEQESTVFIVTHSIEEALYLGDRVYRMGANPGRLVETLQTPRPSVPPEDMRKLPWFAEVCGELSRRLESDSPASGPIYQPEIMKIHA